MENFIFGLIGKEDLNRGYGTYGPVTLPDGSTATLNKIGIHTWTRELSVIDFGATGDGVTDDHVAIQTAIDAAIALRGTVYFPATSPSGATLTYNIGTTSLTATDGFTIRAPRGGAVIKYSGTSYALDLGVSGSTTVGYSISNINILLTANAGHGIKLTRLHRWELHNIYVEGNASGSQTSVALVVDGLTTDSIFGNVHNMVCNHVKTGFQPKSTGTVNTVTTIVFDGFTVYGDSITGSKGIDYGAFGCGDGFTFIGGNLEALDYGVYSNGGAGTAGHHAQHFGLRFETITTDEIYLGSFEQGFGFYGCMNVDNVVATAGKNTFIGNKKSSGLPYPDSLPTVLTLASGSGSPESVITAPIGTLYGQIDGTTGTTLWVKATGSGNTGWEKTPGFAISGSTYSMTMPASGGVTYLILSTGSGSNRITMQAGVGSAAQGGALNLYSPSHGTHPGDAAIGLSSGGGKFRVNNQGLDAGNDLLSMDLTGLFKLLNGTSSGIEFPEISDPSAPAANKGILYCKDNGAGKSQLVVRFPSGAVQVIATEP